jgi:membrane-bound metal-dependent hydrolase YbcI (DUF457 family)
MKGIAHFLTGVALATCFPDVVALARQGSLLPVLGGVGAALPDLLDFRFLRYFEHYDLELDPGLLPGRAAADAVADGLVRAMREAFERGVPRRVMAHTVRLGVDCWRRYTIQLDPRAGTLSVRMGPLVTTGGVVVPGTEPQHAVEPSDAVAVRALDLPLAEADSRHFDVDIFTGPSFTFRREGDRLTVAFLDWHHRWTHSLPVAVAIGACLGVCVGWGWGPVQGRWAAIVALIGATAHVLEDQLGHMGCNLLWPLTRERTPGLGLLHSGDPVPNFLVVWTSIALILLNLDRFAGPGVLSQGPYLLLVMGLPWLLLGGAHLLRRLRGGVDLGAKAGYAVSDGERRSEAEARAD